MLRGALDRAMRNLEIRRRYGELKRTMGSHQAKFELSDLYQLKIRQIDNILYGRY